MKTPGEPIGEWLPLLRSTLEHLAWPATRQREYLTLLGVAPSTDELALEFDDAISPIKGRFEEFGIGRELQEALLVLDELLDNMSQPDRVGDVWSWMALDRHPWNEVRRLASEALNQCACVGQN